MLTKLTAAKLFPMRQFLFFLFLSSALAYSGEERLFSVEKSYNSQNIVVATAHLDQNCKFMNINNRYIDFYWLMDKQKRKEVHMAIRKGVEERISFMGINSRLDGFRLKLNDLNEVHHDIPEPVIEVSSSRSPKGSCSVSSIIALGGSHSYKRMKIRRIFCQTETTLGLPTGCASLTLEGIDADTNRELRSVYFAK